MCAPHGLRLATARGQGTRFFVFGRLEVVSVVQAIAAGRRGPAVRATARRLFSGDRLPHFRAENTRETRKNHRPPGTAPTLDASRWDRLIHQSKVTAGSRRKGMARAVVVDESAGSRTSVTGTAVDLPPDSNSFPRRRKRSPHFDTDRSSRRPAQLGRRRRRRRRRRRKKIGGRKDAKQKAAEKYLVRKCFRA